MCMCGTGSLVLTDDVTADESSRLNSEAILSYTQSNAAKLIGKLIVTVQADNGLKCILKAT